MMLPWTDPLVIGGLVLVVLIAFRAGHAIWREHKRRRHQRLLKKRDIRYIVGDYRARYGTHDALEHLQEDLVVTRARMEKLAVHWKGCQKRAAEAVEVQQRCSTAAEERRAYQAFAAEAHRLQQLKRAHEELKG
jgi:hypothetical protein